MIAAWRLVAPKWAATAFDGEGARLAGGRWNSKGIPVVYLASSLALAALELLVHIDYAQALENFVAIRVEIDEALILQVAPELLEADWSSPAQLTHTQAIGDAWINSKASAFLAVPSSVVPAERNYLFNPQHPDASKATFGPSEPFRYDPRLLKSSPRGAENS